MPFWGEICVFLAIPVNTPISACATKRLWSHKSVIPQGHSRHSVEPPHPVTSSGANKRKPGPPPILNSVCETHTHTHTHLEENKEPVWPLTGLFVHWPVCHLLQTYLQGFFGGQGVWCCNDKMKIDVFFLTNELITSSAKVPSIVATCRLDQDLAPAALTEERIFLWASLSSKMRWFPANETHTRRYSFRHPSINYSNLRGDNSGKCKMDKRANNTHLSIL